MDEGEGCFLARKYQDEIRRPIGEVKAFPLVSNAHNSFQKSFYRRFQAMGKSLEAWLERRFGSALDGSVKKEAKKNLVILHHPLHAIAFQRAQEKGFRVMPIPCQEASY